MTRPQNTDFYDTIADAIDQTHLRSRIDRIWLGGGAGENGGAGQRPGGFIGQLNQPMVSYDITEEATYLGSGSLLDNLNHIRYNVATLSGILGSNYLTVREADDSPEILQVNDLIFSGAFIVTNPSSRKAQIELYSGWFNDTYVNSIGDIMTGPLSVNAKIYTSNEFEIDGDLNHDGSNIGFFGATPAAQSTGWNISNSSTDKTFDADSTSIDELADVLGTLIDYLKSIGILGA